MRVIACFVAAAVLVTGVALAQPPAQPTQSHQGSKGDLPPLKVTIDRSKVDLKHHHLEVRLSRTAASVHIKVLDDSGRVIADEKHDFRGKPAGTPLVVHWTPQNDAPVAQIDVFGYDTDGYYAGVRIVPWSINVPHQEVLFDNDSAAIKPSQKPKLEASYGLIVKAIDLHKDLGPIKLFIAGYTDTVGTAEHNFELSRRRARSIAAWFRSRGIRVPIYYAGFGESVLKVKTADNVPEPRNRRADYILAIEPPSMKHGASAAWHRL
jgi:outer membrane protein OmpA-like peptidoglycan-associated protein